MADQLLPCPFCGGVAEIDTNQFFIAIKGGKAEYRAAIYCAGSCTADMGVCYSDVPGMSRDDVVSLVKEMWNTRAPDAGMRKVQVSSHSFEIEPWKWACREMIRGGLET